MAAKYTYKAFISYRHMSLDKKVAERLQKMLENYKIPKGMAKQEKWRIFRDETELQTSSNLSEDIKTALKNSEFLIVVCSTVTAKSRWCVEEIRCFKELHNQTNDNIITLLIDGEPDEVFPKELCTTMVDRVDDDGYVRREEVIVEPLAANITSGNKRHTLKKLRSEFLRIVAPLIGCGYDDLYNRERRRKIKRFGIGIAAAFAFVTAFGVYNSAMLMKLNTANIELANKNAELELKTKELDDSNTELKHTNEELDNTNAELDKTNTELDESNSSLEGKNTELDKVNSQLTTTNKNLDKANTDLQKSNVALDKTNSDLQASNASLEKKTQEAEDNLKEANKQRNLAEENLAEANRQKKIAEENFAEADRQKNLAEANAEEANTQKNIAEENLALAKEKNQQLRIGNANMAARIAETDIKNNDRENAIKTILANRPYENDPNLLLPSGMNVLSKAIYVYQSTNAPQIDRTLSTASDIKYCEYNADYTKILAYDKDGLLYVWDVNNGTLVFNYNAGSRIIEAVFSLNDDTISVVTSTEIFSIKDDGCIAWSKTTRDIFNESYTPSLDKAALSKDKKVMVLRSSNHFAFMDTLSGEIIYDDTITGDYLNYRVGDFYDNTKYIISYCTSEEDTSGNYKYNAHFIHFDIDNKKWEEIPYETDVYVCGLAYCAENGFSIEGYKYNENDKLNYWINTVKTDGTEVYSKMLPDDYSQWTWDIIFKPMVWENENLELLMLCSASDLLFIDLKTGDIYHREKFDKNIKKVYATSTDGVLRVLCEDGVYAYYLPGTKAMKELSVNDDSAIAGLFVFDDTDSEATQFFLWGNYDKFAVVGNDRTNIVLYKKQEDKNYTEIDQNSYASRVKISEQGSYFTISDLKNIYIYNSENKELLSVIPYANDYYLFDNSILIKDNKEYIWYDIYSGKLKKTESLEDYYSGLKFTNNKVIGLCGDKLIIITNDDIQEVPISIDEGYISSNSMYINNNGSKVISEANIRSEDGKYYELKLIDTTNGECKILCRDDKSFLSTVDYNSDNAVFGKNKFALYLDKKLVIYNTNTLKIDNEIALDNVSVNKMMFLPGDDCLMLYSNNNILYKFDVNSGQLIGKLSLPLNKYEPATKINMTLNEKQNNIILSRSTRAWFIDTELMEIVTELPYGYVGFIPLTQEVIMSNYDTTRFYPYYTSERLIKMAEDIINKK